VSEGLALFVARPCARCLCTMVNANRRDKAAGRPMIIRGAPGKPIILFPFISLFIYPFGLSRGLPLAAHGTYLSDASNVRLGRRVCGRNDDRDVNYQHRGGLIRDFPNFNREREG